MPVIKCKMCGGDLNIVEDSTVCECEYCGTKQTVPKVDDEKKMKLFSRAGKLLRGCEFDKASGVFESIIADFPEEAEAYWGLILCKYGIEYVDDPATGKKVPTCHRSSFESVEDDSNFEQACENADAVARRVYRDEARQIETLRKRILEVSGKEEPYDVFISYKELDEDGDRTPDSVIAQDIYRALTKEGYRVFFSRISLEGKLGVEYEPYIFAALNSAKVMIVVGTDYEYFDAVWVKNEWSRFLKLIASGQQKTVIPVYKDMDPYDMPKELRILAAQNMGQIGAMQDLLHGVEKLLGKKNEQTPKESPVIVQSSGANMDALLDRGYMALEDEEWSNAKSMFNQVLNMNSRSADAYLGLAMAEGKCRNRSELHDLYVFSNSKCIKSKSLFRAKQFGNEELKRWFKSLDTEVEEYQLAKAKADKEAAEKADKARLEKKEAEQKALEKKKDELSLVRKKILPARQRIAAGKQCTLGLRSDGTVIAAKPDWARPGGYPLYRGEFETNDWKEIISIAAGREYTVGLKENGTVLAVGENDEGQCNVNQWTEIVAITTGYHHTVGLKADGTVVAVGNNEYGQCDVYNWTNIISIYAGFSYTLGIKSDGTLVAVGSDDINLAVAEWRDIVEVADASCLFGLKSDGTVIYAGDDNTYDYLFKDDISKWHDIVAISGNGKNLVALRADGKVFATVTKFSGNSHGECCVDEWSNVVAIETGDFHTVGLKTDGTVVAVGSNNLNQCNVSGWKLFDNYETIEDDRKASIEKAKAERKAKREARVQVLNKEQSALQDELANLRGIFSGKRRREIEARLAEIGAELKKLQ